MLATKKKPPVKPSTSIDIQNTSTPVNIYESVPLFSKTFGDAIAEALEQAEKSEPSGIIIKFKFDLFSNIFINISEISSSGKKKKKNKQKVLFSTTMSYSGK